MFFFDYTSVIPIYSLYLLQIIKTNKIMANKRKLKKLINYICSDLFSECMAAALYSTDKTEEVNAILTSIIITQRKYICRVSHPEPGMTPKAYFKKIKKKFSIQIGEITDSIAGI